MVTITAFPWKKLNQQEIYVWVKIIEWIIKKIHLQYGNNQNLKNFRKSAIISEIFSCGKISLNWAQVINLTPKDIPFSRHCDVLKTSQKHTGTIEKFLCKTLKRWSYIKSVQRTLVGHDILKLPFSDATRSQFTRPLFDSCLLNFIL